MLVTPIADGGVGVVVAPHCDAALVADGDTHDALSYQLEPASPARGLMLISPDTPSEKRVAGEQLEADYLHVLGVGVALPASMPKAVCL